MSIFSKKQDQPSSEHRDFFYLSPDTFYFDSACQTLRPQQVIDAEVEYYKEFNACGHRVKYKWGEKVDQITEEAKKGVLKFLNKSDKDYTVAFTLNTTYGINLILHQLIPEGFDKITTSDIEHNSVFLPTMTYSKQHNLQRVVLSRENDGSVQYSDEDITKSIVLLNTTSNIDGRHLLNVKELTERSHEKGSIIFLDAAQTMAHNPDLVRDVDFDALFTSVHKMYGPSLGIIIIKKDLLKKLSLFFIGGGTVQDVQLNDYTLIENDDELFARIEPGLQNWAGIVGLNEAIKWLQSFKKDGKNAIEYEHDLAQYLTDGLKEIPQINLMNPNATPTNSIYSEKIDSHQLALMLAQRNIMVRSGYFCCHYYLAQVKNVPPLLRVSLGLNNTKEQIDELLTSIRTVVANI